MSVKQPKIMHKYKRLNFIETPIPYMSSKKKNNKFWT